MAFEYQKEKQKQKMLTGVLVGIIVLTAVVVWYGYGRPVTPASTVSMVVTASYKDININFDLLNGQALKDLEIFNDAPAYSGSTEKSDLFKTGTSVIRQTTPTTENIIAPNE